VGGMSDSIERIAEEMEAAESESATYWAARLRAIASPERIPYLPPEDRETLRNLANGIRNFGEGYDVLRTGWSEPYFYKWADTIRAILARLEGKP